MIAEVIIASVLSAAIIASGLTALVGILINRSLRERPRAVSQEMRDEIEQNAAWWDREFTSLMQKTDPLYGYYPEYVRAVQLRAGLAPDGIVGPITQRALTSGDYLSPCTFSWYGSTGERRHCRYLDKHDGPHRDVNNSWSWIARGAERFTYPPPPVTDPSAFMKVLR